MNEKGTHNLGTVDMTLRYHFETGRGGSQSGQSNNRDSEGRLDYRVADTLGGQSPVDGEALGKALGRVRPCDLGVPGPGPR